MQQATWNHAQYLNVLSWALLSAAVTSAQLVFIFFPFGSLEEYLLVSVWPTHLPDSSS